MAAVTPASVAQANLGDLRLLVCSFANTTDDGDTWASALPGIFAYWAVDTDDPTTQASVGVAVGLSSSTFTFYPAEDNKSFNLFILQRA